MEGKRRNFSLVKGWRDRACAGPAEPVVEILSTIKEVKKLQGQVVLQEQGMGGPHQCNVHTVGSHQEQTWFIPVENTVLKAEQLNDSSYRLSEALKF